MRYLTRDAAIEACNDATYLYGFTHSVIKLGFFDYLVITGQNELSLYVSLIKENEP